MKVSRAKTYKRYIIFDVQIKTLGFSVWMADAQLYQNCTPIHLNRDSN